MSHFQQIHGHWFFEHFYGHISTKGYFHCAIKSCPFSLKVRFILLDGKKTPSTVEKVAFPFHCHEFPTRSKRANREMIDEERKLIECGQDVGGLLEAKHDKWQEKAKEDGKEFMRDIVDRETTVEYACQRPHLSGRKVEQHSNGKMTRYAIDMARLRQMKQRGDVVTLDELNTIGKHHLLKREGDEVIIFGLKSAVMRMAATKMILSDGTFKCVLPGFVQLYIFIALSKTTSPFPCCSVY